MQSIQPVWPGGRRAAVSLTYDDGIENHPGFVAPALEHYGLRGTFYAPTKDHLSKDPAAWRAMAARGHELGNHTVFHPCWSVYGRFDDWLPEQYNLENYTPERWVEEIATANQALWLIDGKTERSFGNTCFDLYLGPKDAPVALETLCPGHFVAARGEATGKPVNFSSLNLYNLGTVWADRRAFPDFESELAALIEQGGWIIYTMHGVGAGTHNHYIDALEHERLLAFLKAQQRQLWTAPVIDVVRQIQKQQPAVRQDA